MGSSRYGDKVREDYTSLLRFDQIGLKKERGWKIFFLLQPNSLHSAKARGAGGRDQFLIPIRFEMIQQIPPFLTDKKPQVAIYPFQNP
jgi:hypothetical protein